MEAASSLTVTASHPKHLDLELVTILTTSHIVQDPSNCSSILYLMFRRSAFCSVDRVLNLVTDSKSLSTI